MSSNQVPRGTLADAESQDAMYLFKKTSTLRLTYQIRLLTYFAVKSQRTLVINVPRCCIIHESLQTLAEQFPQSLRIDKVD